MIRGLKEVGKSKDIRCPFTIWMLVMVINGLCAIGYGVRATAMGEPHEWPATMMCTIVVFFSAVKLNKILR